LRNLKDHNYHYLLFSILFYLIEVLIRIDYEFNFFYF